MCKVALTPPVSKPILQNFYRTDVHYAYLSFLLLVQGITKYYFLSPAKPLPIVPLHVLRFSQQHSAVFCRQTQLIQRYVMVTVALPSDRTRCSFRGRGTSAVVCRQRLCVVGCVWCVRFTNCSELLPGK
jgi:hypothetical protein